MKSVILGILAFVFIVSSEARAGSVCKGTYNDINISGDQTNLIVKFVRSARFPGKVLKMKFRGHDGAKFFYSDSTSIDQKARAYLEPTVYSKGQGAMSVHMKQSGGKNGFWRRYSYICQ